MKTPEGREVFRGFSFWLHATACLQGLGGSNTATGQFASGLQLSGVLLSTQALMAMAVCGLGSLPNARTPPKRSVAVLFAITTVSSTDSPLVGDN